MVQVVALVSVVVFVLVHLFASKLRFLSGTPRSIWLSAAGGVSVAYVFLHLLPELAESQETLREAVGGALSFLEHHVYLLALMGLALFYGLERLALASRHEADRTVEDASTSPGVFWIHIGSFAVYNLLIGYLLLHREESDLQALIFFAVAMALHFIVNDNGLREHHKRTYDRLGRWILAAAVVAGFVLGLLVEIEEAMIAVLIALIAGGVILNVLKEELPEERESRFSAFAAGAAAYSALLLAL